MEDLEDGRYSNFMVGCVAGSYEVHVTFENQPLRNSPVPFRIMPAAASADHSAVACTRFFTPKQLAVLDQ